MKKYYYTYKTTNLANGKKYIGQHCTYDLDDGYFGSCNELKSDIKDGDSYKVKILKRCKNIWHLGYEEKEEIKRRNAIKDKSYYNKHNRLYVNYHFEFPYPESCKKKISKANKGEKNGMYGKTHNLSEEAKEKIGAAHRGRVHTGQALKNIQQAARNRTNEVWNKGIKVPLLECPHCGKVGGNSGMTRYHFEKCKYK